MTKPKYSIEHIVETDGRYPLSAVQFLREGLGYTVNQCYTEKQQEEAGGRCHVTGRQLCEGLRDMAHKKWGLLSYSVLKSWNVTRTRDFGEMVFLLVENGWMHKEPQDNIEDFDEVYDFQEALVRDYDFGAE